MKAPQRRLHHGGTSTASCCSTSREACRRTQRCSTRSACSTRPRRAIPGRSIRWRADCCRSASARRPSSRNCCSSADKTYAVTIRLGATTTTGDAEGEVTLRTAGAMFRAPSSKPCCRVSSATSRSVRRGMRRSSTRVATTTNTRAKASRFRAPRATSSSTSSTLATMGAPADRLCGPLRQGDVHPGARRGPGRGRSAAARMSRRCAAPRPAASASPTR